MLNDHTFMAQKDCPTHAKWVDMKHTTHRFHEDLHLSPTEEVLCGLCGLEKRSDTVGHVEETSLDPAINNTE